MGPHPRQHWRFEASAIPTTRPPRGRSGSRNHTLAQLGQAGAGATRPRDCRGRFAVRGAAACCAGTRFGESRVSRLAADPPCLRIRAGMPSRGASRLRLSRKRLSAAVLWRGADDWFAQVAATPPALSPLLVLGGGSGEGSRRCLAHWAASRTTVGRHDKRRCRWTPSRTRPGGPPASTGELPGGSAVSRSRSA